MTTLYLGTDPSRFPHQENLVHFPLIQIAPLPLTQDISCTTHVLVTSPNTAHLLWQAFQEKKLFAIGAGTEAVLRSYGLSVSHVVLSASQEGMIELLSTMDLSDAYVFYPRSTRARPLLADYLRERKIRYLIHDAYETVYVRPQVVIDFATVEEMIFTSPTTVHAFLELYGKVPEHIRCTCIGPITAACFLKQTGVHSSKIGVGHDV